MALLSKWHKPVLLAAAQDKVSKPRWTTTLSALQLRRWTGQNDNHFSILFPDQSKQQLVLAWLTTALSHP
ncbi:hypothetical protein [Gallaecimonas sp. GXIMD1310]|uniref:hypothetical protein n=1 Tax=Gallaecimonas sp. GXIMD1310 TaxID=3131926 RepID=UPI0032489C52